MRKINKDHGKMDYDGKYPAQCEVQKIKFIYNSMYLNPFIPITDLTFIVDELRAVIKYWKQRNQQQFNRPSHETF